MRLCRLVGMFASAIAPLAASAQVPGSNLGLAAVGAMGVHAGVARIERDSDGYEAGVFLDLGWMRGRSVRLQAEVAVLRATLTEFVEVDDSTYQGDYVDLSAGTSVVWLASPGGRVSPYALAGVAVHALSSTFGTLALDRRYNTNRFGSHVGAGLRVRLGGGPGAFYAEARRVIADEVDRTDLRVGGVFMLGDLVHRSRR